ncbi:DUF2304 domain-containing protein [Paenibacillus arenosi]|uniref:DUF2304 domain-containing protein n=1 Tax=Paenibacillus arenosi TaxID=2774142 RepID=A0ABR9B3Q0_9BACL|nr:DUF2304 domain-containing protein [Paenibacillus arenosi]
MIPFNLQLILIISNILLLIFLLNNIRKYKLELKYTLLWLGLILITFILSIFPSVLNFISSNIYIETPVNALFLIAFAVVFTILYRFTVIISNLTNQTKKLTQELGLLRNELNASLLKKGSKD